MPPPATATAVADVTKPSDVQQRKATESDTAMTKPAPALVAARVKEEEEPVIKLMPEHSMLSFYNMGTLSFASVTANELIYCILG